MNQFNNRSNIQYMCHIYGQEGGQTWGVYVPLINLLHLSLQLEHARNCVLTRT
jgi:hypothetical protein